MTSILNLPRASRNLAGQQLLQAKPDKSETDSAVENSALPESVQGVLDSPGQPLDADTSALMESKFSHDFSGVRVHADGRAARSTSELNAVAYTVGDHIAFRDYQPATLTGRAILSHELAHTIQQGGAQPSLGEQPGLEAAADQAAIRVAHNQRADVRPVPAAPSIQYLKVTRGGFGRALEEYTDIHSIDDRVVRQLRLSGTFMSMAHTLDANYVWRTDSFNWETRNQLLQYDAQNRITNGPSRFQGKRELMVVGGGSGAAFETIEAPSNPLSSNIIVLNPTSDGEFLRNIAHEAAHARYLVSHSGSAPTTLAAQVAASIQEEIDVRNVEQQVITDIQGNRRSMPGLSFGAAPTTVPAEIERQFSPGLGLTYLENIFFNWRLSETQTSEGLTDDEALDIRREVDQGFPDAPLIFGNSPNQTSGLYELSKYAETYFDYKTARREWTNLRLEVRPTDPGFPAREDAMRQDHAQRFFAGRVAYSP